MRIIHVLRKISSFLLSFVLRWEKISPELKLSAIYLNNLKMFIYLFFYPFSLEELVCTQLGMGEELIGFTLIGYTDA